MKDLLTNEYGDVVVDPLTHDLAIVDGVEEVAQRIRATLKIRLGEMVNLAPDQGTDYTSIFTKQFNENIAKTDIITALQENIPEITDVIDISFKKMPNRVLNVDFKANVNLSDGTTETVEGGLEIDN